MAKVLLVSLEIIGKSMAGPGIRYYEFAKALSKNHEVTLVCPNVTDLAPQDFKMDTHEHLKRHIQESDVVVVQQLTLQMASWIKKFQKNVIIDAYDPQHLEHLEIFKAHPLFMRENRNQVAIDSASLSLSYADGVLCANKTQKDLWLGHLMAIKKIDPSLYDQDPSLHSFLSIVPFGLSHEPLKPMTGVRKKFGIKENDLLLLWGGGIWNWFDPLTLLKAIAKANDKSIKLVFMGVKHPNDKVPEMKMAVDTVRMAKELNLLDSQVFFNYGWTPYEERQAFLNEADVGVSFHLKHLETRYAFRTRLLDYLWAGLPMIVTEGDCFAELIQDKGAGIVVGYEDVDSLAKALIAMKGQSREGMRQASIEIAKTFEWPKVVEPLDKMISKLALNKASPKKSLPLLKAFLKLRNPLTVYKSIMTGRHGR